MDGRSWRQRFDAFVARKTSAVLAAALPPYVTDHEQPGVMMRPIGNSWTRERFDGPFYLSPTTDADRPSCSLVFVQSANRNTGAANPADLGGGATDKHLIYEGLSRVAADAVLVGAETIRHGDLVFSVWHPELVSLRLSFELPRHPVQMIATVRGIEIERTLACNIPELPVIILTVRETAARLSASLSARPWITTILMEEPHQLRRAFEQLPTLGVRLISCIGGRRLARSLLDAGLVDDVYLTTAPCPGGEPNTPLPTAASDGRLVVRKRGTLDEAGVVFEHVAAGQRPFTAVRRQP
jgi:riboflavin biosynthesis pyrimidine reductase